ncbi:hypothetical protein FB451DRAFT_1167934 [Mycena latifolia]|nr:hypothetical protein FB451DRAFT_1167934 [Mycena latifolia]
MIEDLSIFVESNMEKAAADISRPTTRRHGLGCFGKKPPRKLCIVDREHESPRFYFWRAAPLSTAVELIEKGEPDVEPHCVTFGSWFHWSIDTQGEMNGVPAIWREHTSDFSASCGPVSEFVQMLPFHQQQPEWMAIADISERFHLKPAPFRFIAYADDNGGGASTQYNAMTNVCYKTSATAHSIKTIPTTLFLCLYRTSDCTHAAGDGLNQDFSVPYGKVINTEKDVHSVKYSKRLRPC